MENKKQSKLEETVKGLLQNRALSMRRLASLTGINVATISKMLAGKQRVNPEYLQTIAQHLSVPPATLFAAAGFNIETMSIQSEDTSMTHIEEILRRTGLQAHQFSRLSIQQELTKYDGYAKTAEGHELIVTKFPEKRKQISGSGPFVDDLDKMFDRYLETDVSDEERIILGSGLLYFVLSTDAIPDFIFPIGYLDDALAIQITYDRISNLFSRM
jgi:uncharacterized membrane protein YkvA (DUF1232 family)/lambda repressor-like predicted transcriptional regulator